MQLTQDVSSKTMLPHIQLVGRFWGTRQALGASVFGSAPYSLTSFFLLEEVPFYSVSFILCLYPGGWGKMDIKSNVSSKLWVQKSNLGHLIFSDVIFATAPTWPVILGTFLIKVV